MNLEEEEAAATAWCRKRMPDWPALLSDVRAKPGLWTGGRTIRGLRLFRDGITCAERFHGITSDRRLGNFDWERFEAWIAARHNPRGDSVDSFWLAADAAGSDAAGFERWFEWYDEFNAALDRR